MDVLLTLSATELASRIRERQLSSVEVVERYIEQIRRVNPRINALVRERFELARQEAREADGRIRACRPDQILPPLLGVPCTIKESFAIRGLPQTGGLVSRRRHLPKQDATAVARLRAAGAVPLGVTNVSELCMWMESHNRVYGRSNNPYDPGRIVGGSSGGEGAIIGAGGAPFGLGADVGGSIRMPAFFNGVFGHKPTGGLVPNTGQFPIAANQALRYLCTGPLARRASDLMPLLRILAGPDGQDSGCRALPLGDPAEVKLAGLPVVVVPGNPLVPVGREMRQAQDRAASALAVMGARVSIRRFRDLAWSLPIWAAMLHAAGGPTYKQLMGNGRRVNAWRELLRLFLGNSPYTVPSVGLALLEDLPGALGGGSTRRMLEKGRQLRLQIEEALGPEGVMLYPSYPTPAPRHRRPMLPPWYWVYTAIFNMLEFPVTQVPLGLGREGLPLGVQVVSRAGNDHSTIAVALALERAFGGWVPPPLAG